MSFAPSALVGPTEIVAAPKVLWLRYRLHLLLRGWQDLRDDDLGTLWSISLLNEIMARSQSGKFLLARQARARGGLCHRDQRKRPAAIECKWSANNFDPTNLIASSTNIRKATTSSSLTMWSVPSPAAMETYECASMAFGPSPIRFLRRQVKRHCSTQVQKSSGMLERALRKLASHFRAVG